MSRSGHARMVGPRRP